MRRRECGKKENFIFAGRADLVPRRGKCIKDRPSGLYKCLQRAQCGPHRLGVYLFWTKVFHPLVGKHVIRIHGYEEEYKRPWNFFDKKSFLIMAFMMTFGITIRVMNLMPDSFIAFFYTGLGTALVMAGILFLVNYITYDTRAIGEE